MSIGSTSRDIELVLITGAGASRAFGVRGEPLPLMGDWADALVKNLASRGPGFLEVTGLGPQMSGTEFEDRLGLFLRSVAAFGRVEQLLAPSSSFPSPHDLRFNSDQWKNWHSAVSHDLMQVTGVIHETLYQLFGAPRYDLRAAVGAYATLLQQLGVNARTRWVYATTNYDTIAEDALSRIGFRPDSGEVHPIYPSGERVLRVDRPLDGMPRYVPLLHVHGRVGWMRRPDGDAYSANLERFDSGFGTPIVMLPDTEKQYDSDPVVGALWQQLGEALSRARRVFVVGHSLHDAALLRLLHDNVTPHERIAVTVVPEGGDGDEVGARLSALMPTAATVPLLFGDRSGATAEVQEWLQATQGIASSD